MAEENIDINRKEPEDSGPAEEPTRELFVPGDVIDRAEFKPGAGTFASGGKIYSSQLGIKSVRSNYINIIPLGGRYMPHVGDTVIGIIVDIGPSNWYVDISAPYQAPLHVNEAPWRVEFGDTAKFLRIGDAILCEVLSVDEMKKVQVTMNGPQLRKLPQGQIIEISPSKVPRVIGRSGSMIKTIVSYTRCRLFVGQNGRIWIDGELDKISAAVKAIRKIEEKAQVLGLTDMVKELLEREVGRPAPPQQAPPPAQQTAPPQAQEAQPDFQPPQDGQ